MADNANKEIKTATADDGSTGYEMKIGLGTIAMLIWRRAWAWCPCSAAGQLVRTCSTGRWV